MSERLTLLGATVIDGTGTAPVPGAAVVVEDGRVSWIGPAGGVEPNGSPVVDLAGKFVIPGLMDANVHLVADVDPQVLLRYEPGEYDELVVEAAQVALRAGITTVFDTWGPLESLRRVRDRVDAGEVVGSRIFFAGNIIGNRGPWSADFFSRIPGGLNSVTVAAVNQHWEQGVGGDLPRMPAEEVRGVVRDYIASSGVDFVKYASSAHGARHFIALSPDAQGAVVEEAHAAGLVACACAMTPETLKLAIRAGVDLLQHGTSTGIRPMPDELANHIISTQLPTVALLTTERHLEACKADPTAPWEWDKRVVIRDENDRRLIKGGAKLLLAVDGGVFSPSAKTSPAWGSTLVTEPDSPYHLGSSHVLWLHAAVERGMAPLEALASATRNIAEAYRRDDELGTLEPGKRADLVVLDANPLDDVANYARVARVMKDGVFVDLDRLPEHPVLTTSRRRGPAAAGTR